ncbi:hypothetical protein [Geodermatophilus sp. URMC 62]|uniref:hypothetical protein n=1 Tax=Geodermatophilus sp. URMC 62 TaxID=3423414 RepID=UPI00406C5FFF
MLGFEPLPTGLAFLLTIFSLTVSAQVAPSVVGRIGVEVPVTLGFAVAAAGLLLFTRLDVDSGCWTGWCRVWWSSASGSAS